MGGHTEVAKTLIKLLSEKYDIATFLVNRIATYKHAPVKIKKIEQYSKIVSIDELHNNDKLIENLFLKIIDYNPKVLFVFTNMDDVIGTAVLCMIKKFTNIKVIYFNHGSHYPALGFSFVDLILEGMPTTHYITKKYRGFDKCNIIGLVDQKLEDIEYYSSEDILRKRKEFGIFDGNKFTLSGASAYKFFNGEKSEYFEMIKRLLEKDENIQHVVMVELNKEQKKIIDNIFIDSSAKKRLKIIDSSSEYSLVFQSCDVFIDSFPIASALTQVELMKWKKPTVVKINRENSIFSFHEYFPIDYEYMFENITNMENGIFKLLNDKNEQKKITNKLFKHFLQNFEGSVIRDKYINIIENSDNLEQFYDKLDERLEYSLEIFK